jgi:anti-anti-sigma factor
MEAGRAVVKLFGEIDLETAAPLGEEMSLLETQAPVRCLVDLSGVEFIDSTGLGAILRAQTTAEANGHTLTFRRGGHQVQRLFELTGIGDRLTFED